MAAGSSDLVRSVTMERYVKPAIQSGKFHFSVAVRDVMRDLQASGFPPGNYPQICTAIRTGKFLRENGLEIEQIEGPPSGSSPKVVVHYRVARPAVLRVGTSDAQPGIDGFALSRGAPMISVESSEERAERLIAPLRGLLADVIADLGGVEGYMRWVRSDSDEELGPGEEK
jgi:hypothetical protein